MARIALTVLFGLASRLFSQAVPTASRVADVQAGIGYAIGRADYIHQVFPGIAAYAVVDLRTHLGIEAEFHDIFSASGPHSSQRTYELGGRYLRPCGPLVPYAKGTFGIGQFQYPQGLTLMNYWVFAAGVGADFKLTGRVHLRGEYEFQDWRSFPNGGLHPQIVTLAVAYHFPGTLRR